MMKYFWVLVVGAFSSFLTAQEQSSPDFQKIKSGITMPVRIPLQEIGKMVNASVKELIFEDNSYTDNNNDQFKVKVWKTRPIRIVGGTKQNILIEVPLKIWAEKGIGTLGLYNYQDTTFETVMYFNTNLNFKNNWIIETKTQPLGFKWVTKPVLDYGKIKIPITSLVEKSLKEQQQKFCITIDQQMAGQLNFQPYAVNAWNIFSAPFNISEEYNTWLKITPISVNLSPLKIYGNAIDTTIGIDTYSETFTGTQPQSSPILKTVPNLNFVADQSNNFTLQTASHIPFTEATAIANKMFLNKEFDFRNGKTKVKINDVKVYGEDDRVVIEARTEGFVEGVSIISGIPVYNTEKQKIILTNTKFRLKTSNILQKAGVSLFQGKIVKMIEEDYGIPTQDIITTSKKSIEETFNKEYYKGLKMSGKVFNLKPSSVLVRPSELIVVVDTNAQLQLRIQDM